MPEETKNYRKTLLELPTEVVSAFARLADMENVEGRNSYAVALQAAGWTLQSISDAAQITRERVRQIVAKEWPPVDPALPLPEPPSHAVKEPRVFIEPDPVKLQRALALKPLAQSVRSNSPKYREEAEEYSALIADMHLADGVTLYRLAKRLGVTHGALRFRLARYGYKSPKSGDSKVYNRINPENRANNA